MNMSFDEMRNEVAPAARSVTAMPQMMGGGSMMPQVMGGGGGMASMLTHAGRGSMMRGGMSALPPPTAQVPDHPQQLQVYLHGPGADKLARGGGGISLIDPAQVEAACKGKRDFILFEDLDGAVREGRRLVLVTPMGVRPGELKQAQAYLASSLARWLSENKVDGAGRPYGECKDEDPTLRKHFTRAQIQAIRSFGQAV